MAERVDISIRDAERAMPVLQEYFPAVTMSNPRGGFALELAAADAEKFSVVHYRLRAQASSSSADMSDTLTFGQVSTGALGLTARGHSIDTTRPWLFPQHRVDADWDDVTITAFTLSASDTLRHARAVIGDDSAPLTFVGESPVDAVRGRQWSALVDYTRVALAEEDPLILTPLVRENAFAQLAGMVLETFPNSIIEIARHRPTPEVLPSAVRRATSYIDDNARMPITVDDVARESRMSIRALQYAFRRYLDTTPAAYLRSARVAGAHADLRAADPTAGATVLAIATAWGFLNQGRFARLYRDAYGQSPRQTLDD